MEGEFQILGAATLNLRAPIHVLTDVTERRLVISMASSSLSRQNVFFSIDFLKSGMLEVFKRRFQHFINCYSPISLHRPILHKKLNYLIT